MMAVLVAMECLVDHIYYLQIYVLYFCIFCSERHVPL